MFCGLKSLHIWTYKYLNELRGYWFQVVGDLAGLQVQFLHCQDLCQYTLMLPPAADSHPSFLPVFGTAALLPRTGYVVSDDFLKSPAIKSASW